MGDQTHAWELLEEDLHWETRDGVDTYKVYRCSQCGCHIFTSEIRGESVEDGGPWGRMEPLDDGWLKVGDRSPDGLVDAQCPSPGVQQALGEK